MRMRTFLRCSACCHWRGFTLSLCAVHCALRMSVWVWARPRLRKAKMASKPPLVQQGTGGSRRVIVWPVCPLIHCGSPLSGHQIITRAQVHGTPEAAVQLHRGARNARARLILGQVDSGNERTPLPVRVAAQESLTRHLDKARCAPSTWRLCVSSALLPALRRRRYRGGNGGGSWWWRRRRLRRSSGCDSRRPRRRGRCPGRQWRRWRGRIQ